MFCGRVGGARFLCERGLACVRVAWINGKGGRGNLSALVPSPSPPFFSSLVCGANDGTRTRYLHLGRVTLSLLSFIRSVLPGRSLAFASCALFARVRVFCLRWGVERMTGVEPAAFTLAWWYSTRLSYIRVSCRPVLLVVCFCLPAREVGACAYLLISPTSVGVSCAFCQHTVL